MHADLVSESETVLSTYRAPPLASCIEVAVLRRKLHDSIHDGEFLQQRGTTPRHEARG
jgi:hypothetical protein